MADDNALVKAPLNAPVQTPPTELLEKFLVQQAEQIAVRKDELDLEKQKDQHQYDYGLAALKAQVEDRKEQRVAAKTSRRDRLYFSAFVVLILAGFVTYTLYLGKDDFAKETLKGLVFLAVGGLGGYSYKSIRRENHPDDSGGAKE